MSRSPLQIHLSAGEQSELQSLLSGGVQPVRSVLRALVLLQLARGVSAPQIGRAIPSTPQAIRKVGHRFQQGGLDRALYDKQRPAAAPILDDGQKQRIIAMVCSDPPAGRSRWTVRLVAVEPKAGRHFTFPTPDRTAFQFAQCILELAIAYPDATTIHLVMDNLNIHCRKSLTDSFGEDVGGDIWSRFTVHHTPKRGSWLNQAEIEIGIFSRQCLGKRRIPDLKTLRRECRDWNRRINRAKTTINWKFTRKAARKTFGYT